MTEKDVENIKIVTDFLNEIGVEFEYSEESFDFKCGDGVGEWHVTEPIFSFLDAKGEKCQIRYVNSISHKADYSKRFGAVQQGITPHFFGEMSQAKKKEGIRIFWLKDFEITESSDIKDYDGTIIKDYHRKWEVFKSYIRCATGHLQARFYARDCEVREMPREEQRVFMTKYCFYGYRSANVYLGLYLKKDKFGFKAGTPLMITTFGHNYYGNKNHETDPTVEVVRVGSMLNCQIIGGSSKLLNHYLENYPTITFKRDEGDFTAEVARIVYYIDACHNNGNSMEAIGYNYVNWDTGGFHNYAAKEINIPELKVPQGVIFQRKPSIHKKIMELMASGHIISIGNAGTIVYDIKRKDFLEKMNWKEKHND